MWISMQKACLQQLNQVAVEQRGAQLPHIAGIALTQLLPYGTCGVLSGTDELVGQQIAMLNHHHANQHNYADNAWHSCLLPKPCMQ